MNKTKHVLHLTIVSQEKKLLESDVTSLTAITGEGEVTVLPGHIPLFATLVPGELIFKNETGDDSFVISKGFLDVGPDNKVVIMVDTAVAARNISETKAQQAVEQAKSTMAHSSDRHELLMAEASLRSAMMELKVAQRSKKNRI
jgi:F-type H+-transporting ATPase subunit epsilon